jgi:hypothetical protein
VVRNRVARRSIYTQAFAAATTLAAKHLPLASQRTVRRRLPKLTPISWSFVLGPVNPGLFLSAQAGAPSRPFCRFDAASKEDGRGRPDASLPEAVLQEHSRRQSVRREYAHRICDIPIKPCEISAKLPAMEARGNVRVKLDVVSPGHGKE